MVDRTVVRFTGPFAAHREGMREALLARGYTPLSANNLLWLAAHLSRWLVQRGLRIEELDSEGIKQFFAARRAEGYTHFLTPRAMAPILRYCEETGFLFISATVAPAEGAANRLLSRYAHYLQHERCVSPSCVRYYTRVAQEFLRRRFEDDSAIELAEIKAQDVTSFALHTSGRYGVGTSKLAVTALRSFLHYLFLQGDVAVDLRGALPAIASWRLSGLPKALTAVQLRRLLHSCDRRRHVGRRDCAVLLLLARLGLRAGEVSALQLDDIDWRCGEILVHGKGSHNERLPLPTEIGAALATYLRLSRPNVAERTLFVSVRAPHAPLSPSGVSAVVRHACVRAALPAMGAHRLRHTAATEMLRAGSSLDEIAQVLRHRSQDTTAIYAKVDQNALRHLARPWLGEVL